jgi:hypothetical protein
MLQTLVEQLASERSSVPLRFDPIVLFGFVPKHRESVAPAVTVETPRFRSIAPTKSTNSGRGSS